MDGFEIDRVLNDMRDEATKQLRAAGLPESASVRAWYQRFHGCDGEFNQSCYSVQISGEAFHYGDNKPTPDEAIAEVIAWWKANQERRRIENDTALLAEFAEWKRTKSAAEVSK